MDTKIAEMLIRLDAENWVDLKSIPVYILSIAGIKDDKVYANVTYIPESSEYLTKDYTGWMGRLDFSTHKVVPGFEFYKIK